MCLGVDFSPPPNFFFYYDYVVILMFCNFLFVFICGISEKHSIVEDRIIVIRLRSCVNCSSLNVPVFQKYYVYGLGKPTTLISIEVLSLILLITQLECVIFCFSLIYVHILHTLILILYVSYN